MIKKTNARKTVISDGPVPNLTGFCALGKRRSILQLDRSKHDNSEERKPNQRIIRFLVLGMFLLVFIRKFLDSEVKQ